MVALVTQESMMSLVAQESLVSRTGRHLQRYNKGRRQVVGCIPYRYKDVKQNLANNEDDIEVLVISSQKGKGWLFPKGGWELDESIKQAASRETLEEAGVTGILENELGQWSFKSRTQNSFHEGYMFPLLVQNQLEVWPEMNVRERRWISVAEARNVCQHLWMKEALDKLILYLTSTSSQIQEIEEEMVVVL